VHYEELIQEQAPKWHYNVQYGKQNEDTCDVLIIGGGIGGCWAAISAARKGAKVILVEKGAPKTSGSGGSGVDHWTCVPANPASTVSPDEYIKAIIENFNGWTNGIDQYIACRESYDCLLELEKMGVKIRDSEDEFKGAEFRDDTTKFLFAYDYSSRCTIRVWGSGVKTALYKECLSLGVKTYEHVMVTSLLTKEGKLGNKVIGATGVNSRTGEFYIFKGKATVLSIAGCNRNWLFSTELKGLSCGIPPATNSCDGHALAWRAGATFASMEASRQGVPSPYAYPQYGVGNASNTWYGCTMVDARGKEIPYVDNEGQILKTFSERFKPRPGNFWLAQGGLASRGGAVHKYTTPSLMQIPGYKFDPGKTKDVVKKPEYVLPFYADMSSMPEMERKVLWGMMIAQEARTLIPIYRTYTQAGFDPDKDMLQAYEGSWSGVGISHWRQVSGGGMVVDWDLMTDIDGLFAAGGQIFASSDHSSVASTGKYVGRKAADYARTNTELPVDRKQVEIEKMRVYAPLQRKNGIHWKELNAGACKVLQDYCGQEKNEDLLKIGLKWYEELEAGEMTTAYARNPHELVRLLEVFNIIAANRMVLEACLSRKASNSNLSFYRSDFPLVDPPEWQKWVTIKNTNSETKAGELELNYYGDLGKNYAEHCGL
jgi:succinate dehydrogenase/fumarate reductase flavoprotein subunit